jgi:hypothetical protein
VKLVGALFQRLDNLRRWSIPGPFQVSVRFRELLVVVFFVNINNEQRAMEPPKGVVGGRRFEQTVTAFARTYQLGNYFVRLLQHHRPHHLYRSLGIVFVKNVRLQTRCNIL